MPANCVSQSTRNALRDRHHNEHVTRVEANTTHVVVKVQKNGKRVAVTRYDGITRFSEVDAIAFRDKYASMNPHLVLEVEKI